MVYISYHNEKAVRSTEISITFAMATFVNEKFQWFLSCSTAWLRSAHSIFFSYLLSIHTVSFPFSLFFILAFCVCGLNGLKPVWNELIALFNNFSYFHSHVMQIQDQTVKHVAFVSMHRLYRYLLNTRCESHFYKRTNFQLEVLPVVLSQHTIWKYSGVYISLSWVPLMWNAQGYVGCQAFVCPFDNVHNDVCVCVCICLRFIQLQTDLYGPMIWWCVIQYRDWDIIHKQSIPNRICIGAMHQEQWKSRRSTKPMLWPQQQNTKWRIINTTER